MKSAVNGGEIKEHNSHHVSSSEEGSAVALIPGVMGTQASYMCCAGGRWYGREVT